MAIIYLHGFASAGNGEKAVTLRRCLPDVRVEAPTLPPRPDDAIAVAAALVSDLRDAGDRQLLFVGTSLGGFYAWYLSAQFGVPAVLINPAIAPHEATRRWIGSQRNHATGETFDWRTEDVAELARMSQWLDLHGPRHRLTVIVAADDELLDSGQSVRFFDGSAAYLRVYDHGGHRFEGFDRLVPTIAARHREAGAASRTPDGNVDQREEPGQETPSSTSSRNTRDLRRDADRNRTSRGS